MLADVQTGVHSDCSGLLQQVFYSASQFPACARLHGYLSLGWDIYTSHIEHHEASAGPFSYFTLVLLGWNSAFWHVSQFSPQCSIIHKSAETVFCRIIQDADKDIE